MNWNISLGPALLGAVALFAGMLWMMAPVQSKSLPAPRPAEVAHQPVAAAPPAGEPPKLVAAAPAAKSLDRDRELLAKTVQTVRKEREATARGLKSVAAEQQSVFLAIQRDQQRLADLNNGIGALDRTQAELRADVERLAEAATLETSLQAKRAQIARLEIELRNAKNPYEKEITSIPLASAATKTPILVELFRNRAIPVDKKHFHFDVPKWSGPTLATRTDIGETPEEIRDPASGFMKFLSGIRTDKQYLACLLNDDSFEIFREVRAIAKAKGIAVGWEPIDSSAGRITIYPIRFVKDPAKAAKSVNGKPLPRVTAIIE